MKKSAALFMTLIVISLAGCGKPNSVVTNAPSIASSSAASSNVSSVSSSVSSAAQSPIENMSAMDIVTALQDAGLPIIDIVEFDAETDPNELLGRPHQYTQKVNFNDSRLEYVDHDDPSFGVVEIFDSAEDAKARYDYVEALGQGSPLFGYYLYLYDNVLLRVAWDITPEQAAEYGAAFEALTQV